MNNAHRLMALCGRLIDQTAARPIILPQSNQPGFWFGGGNMTRDSQGHLYVVGRYRNAGDSRTGVAAGTRGLELAVFRSTDMGKSFQKIASWDKRALNTADAAVLSIEGSCLRFVPDGVELFVSTEKTGVSYPEEVSSFLKPGAGVWTIDVLRAESLEALPSLQPVACFQSFDPQHLHVKDPFFWPTQSGDRLGFCSHPFSWSSSNTGVVSIPMSGQTAISPTFNVIPRGNTWDVAMTRGTCLLPIPRIGPFEDRVTSLLFYCGGECLRPHEEHATAVQRPRGYSCEEIGGAAFFMDEDPRTLQRISSLHPLFVSPYGTGCSRYVDVLETPEGFYATWQQSQPDLCQPLVMNFVPRGEVEQILRG